MIYFALSELHGHSSFRPRGDALRFAQRLPLAITFRAFGAVWLSHFAPLALSGYHISRLWRCLAIIFRACGAGGLILRPSALGKPT